MKRKPTKHVVVSDMYGTIYSDVVMEDLKEFYPDASDELLDELASDRRDLYCEARTMGRRAQCISHFRRPDARRTVHIWQRYRGSGMVR